MLKQFFLLTIVALSLSSSSHASGYKRCMERANNNLKKAIKLCGESKKDNSCKAEATLCHEMDASACALRHPPKHLKKTN